MCGILPAAATVAQMTVPFFLRRNHKMKLRTSSTSTESFTATFPSRPLGRRGTPGRLHGTPALRDSKTPARYPAALAPTLETLVVPYFRVRQCGFRRTAHHVRIGSSWSWFLSPSQPIAVIICSRTQTSKAEKALIEPPRGDPIAFSLAQ